MRVDIGKYRGRIGLFGIIECKLTVNSYDINMVRTAYM